MTFLNFCHVHRRRLVQLAWDGLQRARRDDRVERPAEPDIGREQPKICERQDERPSGDDRVRVVEPVQGDRRQFEQHADRPVQDLVHRPVLGIEHVAPDGRDDDRRDHDRQDVERPPEPPEPEPWDVQQERDRHAEHDVDHDVRERPPEVEDEDPDEVEVRDDDVVVQDPEVVVEPDDVRRWRLGREVLQAVVREGHVDLEHEGIEGDDGHHQERRQEEEVGRARVARAAPA